MLSLLEHCHGEKTHFSGNGKKAFPFIYGAPMPFLIQLLLGYHRATYNLRKNTPGHIILYCISFAYITNSLYLCKSFVGVGKCLQ